MILTNTALAPSSRLTRRSILGLAAAGALSLAAMPSHAALEAFSNHSAGSAKTVDHAAWDELLKAYVRPGSDGVNYVDYGAWKSNGHKALKGYVASLEAVDPTKLDRPEQFAFWANLYNAKTIDVVLDAYPVDTIRKITINEGLFGFLKKSAGLGGPWKAKIMKVNGQDLSLDNVEHDIMRKVFKDPRVHYAVNCASMGCPNLNVNAFTGANLEAELEKGAKAFVNHPRGIDVKPDGTVVASSIYSWFQVDFGGSEAGVLAHARKYATPEVAAKLEGKTGIASFDYDWDLNDISKMPKTN